MTPQEDAIQLLNGVLQDLTASTARPNLESVLRRCQMACQRVGLTDWENWFKQEVYGYPPDATPSHRLARGKLVWRPVGGVRQRAEAALLAVYNGEDWGADEVTFLQVAASFDVVIALARSGYEEYTSEKKLVGKTPLVRVKVFDSFAFSSILAAIERYAFDFASQQYALLQYGNTVGGIFSEYQKQVDAWLQNLGFKQHFDAIHSGLQSQNPDSWRDAIMGCRTLIGDVANYAWQDRRPTYVHLKGDSKDGKLQVSAKYPKNRLVAYIHQKGFRQTDGGSFLHDELERWNTSMRSLIDIESSAKGKRFTLAEARSIVLATYFIIGELVIKTDAQPIKEYGEPVQSTDSEGNEA